LSISRLTLHFLNAIGLRLRTFFQACYNWRKKFGGMVSDDVKRLRALEEENAKLKRIVANLTLDNLGYKEVLAKKW
jgi:hypothetical protein